MLDKSSPNSKKLQLTNNRHLEHLDLSFNNLGTMTEADTAGIGWIIEALECNGGIKQIVITGNWDAALCQPLLEHFADRVTWR